MPKKGNAASPKRFRPLRVIIAIIIALILIVGIYFAYVFLSYKRIPDNQQLDVNAGSTSPIQTGTEYKLMSYNMGFGAYEPDYGFFMDGGTESWAWSKERLQKNMQAMTDYVAAQQPDIVLFQEVDKDSTRTYHVDEIEYLKNAISGGSSTFGLNWDSPFLFYPITQPHGKSVSGLLTLSRFDIDSAIRRSLPVEDSVMKIIDVDRCYIKNYLPVGDGSKKLVLYNVHMSAYTSDGTVADRQLELLVDDMTDEFNAGNYVICGGDFNKDLLGDSSKYFGISGEEFSWAKPINMNVFSGKPLTLICASNVPSNRNADGPVNPQQFVVVLDGFIVSDNVSVLSNENIDTGFAYSDHNPVTMQFELIP